MTASHTLLSGGLTASAGSRFGIVVGRFNDFISERLLAAAIDTLRRQGCSAEELMQRLGQQFSGQVIEETLRELIALEVVSDGSPLTPEIVLKQVERTALNTVVLNVNTGCNLSCTYCYEYGEDRISPAAAALKRPIAAAWRWTPGSLPACTAPW